MISENSLIHHWNRQLFYMIKDGKQYSHIYIYAAVFIQRLTHVPLICVFPFLKITCIYRWLELCKAQLQVATFSVSLNPFLSSSHFQSFFRFFFSWCRLFSKVFIEFITIYIFFLCFMFWFFGHEACGILVPQPGIEPTSLH